MLTLPVFNGTIPDDVKSAQDLLQRLHSAPMNLNVDEKRLSNYKFPIMSVRKLEAEAFVQTKKKKRGTIIT